MSRPRRQMLKVAGAAAGGAAALTIAPFLGKILLERKSTETGEIVDVDLTPLSPGQLLTVDWQGQPVWILRRTDEMLATLAAEDQLIDPQSEQSRQPHYAKNRHRSIRPDYFVAFGLCPHLGCTPTPRFRPGSDEGMPANWRGGFLCPCHTSTFDFAGRAHGGREAKRNLDVPPYRFLSDQRLLIGEDPPTRL